MRTCGFLVLALIGVTVPVFASEEDAAALLDQAQEEFQARNYASAATVFEASDRLSPRLTTKYDVALAYLYAGMCDASRRAVEQLIDRTAELRDNATVGQARTALLGHVEAPEGERCALVNRLLRSVDEALGIELESNVREVDARNFAQEARRYYEADDFASAATLYETAHATYPMLVDTLFNAGMAYHLAGQHAEALGAFRRVVEQSPETVRHDPDVERVLAESATLDSRTDAQLCELASRLRQTIAAASGERTTRSEAAAARRVFDRGVAVAQEGDFRQAAVFFDCTNLIKSTGASRRNSCVAHMSARQWVEALQAFRSYVSQHPDLASDPQVLQALEAIEAEPYASDERAQNLYAILDFFICEALNLDCSENSTGGSE
jgi:tetratricopeptide (TPR) repeat protein